MPETLLSLIVPLAPADRLDPGLCAALEQRPADCQLILSAGPTQPESVPAGAQVLTGPAGRGRQLNRGAAQASGVWLWFIHADSRLGKEDIDHAINFAQNNGDAIGYCHLRFRRDGPALTRLNAVGANLRSRLFGLPYGDQGLCLPAERFRRLGGFREDLERGEDLDLVVRARAAGLVARPMGISVSTSARRYGEQGWLATTWRHQVSAWRLIRDARQSRRSNST